MTEELGSIDHVLYHSGVGLCVLWEVRILDDAVFWELAKSFDEYVAEQVVRAAREKKRWRLDKSVKKGE